MPKPSSEAAKSKATGLAISTVVIGLESRTYLLGILALLGLHSCLRLASFGGWGERAGAAGGAGRKPCSLLTASDSRALAFSESYAG